MDHILQKKSVKRVRDALMAQGSEDKVIALSDTARTAEDAATALKVNVGAIVKSLVFDVEGQLVMALVAGDRKACVNELPKVLGLDGKAKRADVDKVRDVTGFAIGGVSPLGHLETIPIALDSSLDRFDTIYAAAGHPHAVFETGYEELLNLTKAVESEKLSKE
jgi:prolyl-tRNA editing enzyme YbaK/EbsC (Cys-tRNA(Pro) deacylase)